MPKILRARVAHDEKEARQLRKLATSRHGPADWIVRARMVVHSWDGMCVDAIAFETTDVHVTGGAPQTAIVPLLK